MLCVCMCVTIVVVVVVAAAAVFPSAVAVAVAIYCCCHILSYYFSPTQSMVAGLTGVHGAPVVCLVVEVLSQELARVPTPPHNMAEKTAKDLQCRQESVTLNLAQVITYCSI